MLTKNGYALISCLSFSAGTFPVTKYDGTSAYIVYYRSGSTYYPFALQTMTYVTATVSQAGMCIGSGSTPATADDYALESPISSGFSSSLSSFARASGDGAEMVYQAIITNASGADLTVAEVGFYGRGYTSASGSSYVNLLIDRTVLDEPVTIPNGEARTISYTIRLNWPV